MKTPSLYVGFKIRGKSRRAQGYFFSERKEKVEEWIARGGKREQTQSTNSGSKSDVPAASDNGEESKDQRAPEPQLRPFEQLTNRFIHSMNQFDRLIPTTLSVLPVAEMMQMNEKFYEPIAKAGASSEHDVDLGGVAVGDQLVISPKYLQDATEVISELGLKLIQVIWRKLKPGDIAVAASVLNDQAFELLIRRRYELARVMLEFGLALKKNGDELTRKMLVVNLAIATKFVETPDAALRILNNEDWTASSDKFQICVAAVKDDVVAVIKYLPNVAASGEIPKEGFRHWPAFLTVKEHPEFIKAFESAFGEAFVPDRSSSEEPPGVPQPARDDSTQDSEAEPQELTDQLKPSAKSTQSRVRQQKGERWRDNTLQTCLPGMMEGQRPGASIRTLKRSHPPSWDNPAKD